MEYQQLARRWLDDNGLSGKVIAQRQYPDRFVVVLDSGQKVDIPLADLAAMNIPEPAPPALALAKPKRKRRRHK
jgi:hypothetical protein